MKICSIQLKALLYKKQFILIQLYMDMDSRHVPVQPSHSDLDIPFSTLKPRNILLSAFQGCQASKFRFHSVMKRHACELWMSWISPPSVPPQIPFFPTCPRLGCAEVKKEVGAVRQTNYSGESGGHTCQVHISHISVAREDPPGEYWCWWETLIYYNRIGWFFTTEPEALFSAWVNFSVFSLQSSSTFMSHQ